LQHFVYGSGAFFHKQLDDQIERTELFYVRFIDDVLVLSPTRWRLRKAVKAVNQVLGSLRLEKHRTRPLSAELGVVSISSGIAWNRGSSPWRRVRFITS
jgi:hypothetical protein